MNARIARKVCKVATHDLIVPTKAEARRINKRSDAYESGRWPGVPVARAFLAIGVLQKHLNAWKKRHPRTEFPERYTI